MGDKKQKEAMMKKVKQVLVIGACVLFVVLMIISGMGSGWLTMFTVVKPGDKVIVDYTFYDISGNPLLTTNQQTYTQLAGQGKSILFGRQLSVTPGVNLTKSLYPVQIYSSDSGWSQSFAIFGMEYDAIGQNVIGMKTGDRKRVVLPNTSLTQSWSRETLIRNNVSMDLMNVGDSLAMGVSDKPQEMASNSSVTYTRIGEITSKSADGIVIDFGYPYMDITVTAINPTSS
jgi:hypothetical protein